MKKIKVLFLLILFSLLIFPFLSFQDNFEEKILFFSSAISIAEDGSITVHETIVVDCQNIEINHGIYRDLPLYDNTNKFLLKTLGLEIIEGKLDGNLAIAKIEKKEGNQRIYLGDPNNIIEKGIHTFEIIYKYDSIIKSNDDEELFYFNITGNNWNFPILKATATIVFPEKFFTNSDFSFSKIEAYTGFKSSTEKNYKLEVETKKPNILFFETTSPLQKYQGLTVYIKWNNNFFSLKDEKSQDKFSKIKKQIMNFYFSNSSASIFLLGSIILFIYYLIAWSFVGKDPKKLKIPPSTNIIENFSPVAIRYLNKMGFDTKCISVSIISLASKGYCTIECTKEKLILKKTGKEVELSEDEKQIAKLIFSGDSNTFTFDKYSYPLYQIIYQEYKKYLSSKYKNVYFVTNSIFYIIGILISLVTFVLAIFKALNEFEYGFVLLWLSFWTVGVVGLLTATIQTWKSRKYSGPGNLIILSIFSSIFILAEVFVFFFFISVMKIYPLLITIIPAIILIILNSIYFKLLKRPTKEGIAIYEEIEALKRFLNQISQDLKNQNHELNLTLELDQLIVYALALDMQQDWFETIFNPSNTSATSYFFHGSTSIPWVVSQEHSSYSNITSLFHYINSSLSSGSSSSSSSGGSSGGGSGGGGGGGW